MYKINSIIYFYAYNIILLIFCLYIILITLTKLSTFDPQKAFFTWLTSNLLDITLKKALLFKI